MARPTEPGWYWVKDGKGDWEVVHVFEMGRLKYGRVLALQFAGFEDTFELDSYSSIVEWGERIPEP